MQLAWWQNPKMNHRVHLQLACNKRIISAKCESDSVIVASTRSFLKRPLSVKDVTYGTACCDNAVTNAFCILGNGGEKQAKPGTHVLSSCFIVSGYFLNLVSQNTDCACRLFHEKWNMSSCNFYHGNAKIFSYMISRSHLYFMIGWIKLR